MRLSTLGWTFTSVILCYLTYVVYKHDVLTPKFDVTNQIRHFPSDCSSLNLTYTGAFSNNRRHVSLPKDFKPMTINVNRNASFDYKAAMQQLNDEKVAQDDPRLIDLIRNYYIEPPSDLEYVLKYPDHVDASIGQAAFVDSRLGFLEGGFYVEAGALDGERGSNSLFFERVRKWNGLLVEGDPSNFEILRSRHRKAFSINACLNPQPYPAILTYNKAFNMGRAVHNTEVEEWVENEKLPVNRVSVQCFPLYSILLAMNQLTVDFLSLDIEGDELYVLKTIPFAKVDIKMMAVEYKHTKEERGGLKTFVQGQGYDDVLQISRWDDRCNDIIFRKKGLKPLFP